MQKWVCKKQACSGTYTSPIRVQAVTCPVCHGDMKLDDRPAPGPAKD